MCLDNRELLKIRYLAYLHAGRLEFDLPRKTFSFTKKPQENSKKEYFARNTASLRPKMNFDEGSFSFENPLSHSSKDLTNTQSGKTMGISKVDTFVMNKIEESHTNKAVLTLHNNPNDIDSITPIDDLSPDRKSVV